MKIRVVKFVTMVLHIDNALELAVHLDPRQLNPLNFLKSIEPSFPFPRGP